MGNSTGVIVPKVILDELGLASGSKIDLRVVDGKFVGEPVKRKIREGWEEDAKRIGAVTLTEEERDWLEFDDPLSGESEW
jgi:antitoxin MazE